jgi:hypothetical protein
VCVCVGVYVCMHVCIYVSIECLRAMLCNGCVGDVNEIVGRLFGAVFVCVCMYICMYGVLKSYIAQRLCRKIQSLQSIYVYIYMPT